MPRSVMDGMPIVTFSLVGPLTAKADKTTDPCSANDAMLHVAVLAYGGRTMLHVWLVDDT